METERYTNCHCDEYGQDGYDRHPFTFPIGDFALKVGCSSIFSAKSANRLILFLLLIGRKHWRNEFEGCGRPCCSFGDETSESGIGSECFDTLKQELRD